MKITFFRAGLFLLGWMAVGTALPQDTGKGPGMEPPALSPADLFVLANIPPLEVPPVYLSDNAPLLPYWIDNSAQPYFRSITTQSGFECGQSAGVAFNFTYEVDRLRTVPANTGNNQYPTHFVWDFLNSGDNYVGASFFDSWEIVRTCGTMNVTDYGGTLNFGGYKRWISGYDVYYNGMKNRLNSVRAIRVDNPAGLQVLKYWLWDHLEGSSIGGVANFYAKYYSSVTTVLPPGTPEAGKYVQTSWGSSPSHAWTVCGFNDSIRFDYNNDGQYTNNLDITGDGIVDMHDWEIGGLKFASGYAGTGWCNLGFCYLMYKTLADDIGYGGIWNHTVYVIDVKETCDPKLTMKVTLKHTSRDKVKVTVGMSTDLSAILPNYIYEYPIFAFQGGPNYMQGGTNESDKTIEFGLDLTPVLSRLTSGQAAKYFLQVQENDPGNSFPGEIIQMALIDYTSTTPQTINCASTNVTLLNNDITRISVNHTVWFNKPSVTTSSLPMATLYQPYSFQLAAAGGTTPYLWDVQLDYPETVTTSIFPSVTAQQLTVTNANTGYAIQVLGFPFPFYKDILDTLYIYVDGFILFDDQPYTYPYLVDPKLLFRQTRTVSPFMADLRLYPAQGDGIWYEGDATSATIRWKASVNNLPGTTSLDIAVKFYAYGLIEYYYGNMNFPAGMAWTGGMSSGDNRNYQYSQLNGSSAITVNTLDKFTACGYPVEMNLSESGIFSGTPQYAYANQPVKFRVTDNNGISNTRVLNFTTNGLQIGYSVTAGGDSLIEFGDTAIINLSLTNLGTQPVTNINTWITESDPYISLIDSSQYIGTVNGGQTTLVSGAFIFHISPDVPDQHPFTLWLHETSAQQNFITGIDLVALAPDLVIAEVDVSDGDNGQPDPGETTPLVITLGNQGGARVENLAVTLTSGDPLLAITQGSGIIPVLEPDSSGQLAFQISVSDQAPFEHMYLAPAELTGNKGYARNDSVWLFSGDIVEDFETGTCGKFPWYFGGDAPWNIDQVLMMEGIYSLKSGWIFDNMESHVLLTVHVLAGGEISFWRRVSCENDTTGTDADYLAFFIDDIEQGRWDGDLPWQRNSYPVTPGYHTFKWLFHKDNSVSSYFNACWIDFITFPPFEGALPEITANPAAFSKVLDPGQTSTDTIIVTNTGGGLLDYRLQVFDTTAGKAVESDNLTGSSLVCSASSVSPGETFTWTFTVFNTSNDNEYLKHLRMEFPQGVTVTAATDFTGGSLGDLVYDSSTGPGATVNWHGESAGGRGVIRPGESAVAAVSGCADMQSSFDVFIVSVISGDSTGSAPHCIPAEIRIGNTGLPNSWLSTSSSGGNLLPGESHDIALIFTAGALPPGDYSCDLLVRDPWNNILPVPVSLHVNYPIGTEDPAGNTVSGLSVFPNPFRDLTRILFRLQTSAEVRLDITALTGEPVIILLDRRLPSGDQAVEWDGSDTHGSHVTPGVYLLRLTAGNTILTRKLMLVR